MMKGEGTRTVLISRFIFFIRVRFTTNARKTVVEILLIEFAIEKSKDL